MNSYSLILFRIFFTATPAGGAAGFRGVLHGAKFCFDLDTQVSQKSSRQDSAGIHDYGVIFDFEFLVVQINEIAKGSAMAKSSERGNGGEVVVAADSLVFAGRLLPRDVLAKELAEIYNGADCILSAGDCVKVDSIMHAVWGSFTAVRGIAA